jgi:hypothetical protein
MNYVILKLCEKLMFIIFVLLLLAKLILFIQRYGHQDQVMAIDTLSRERCVSVGARDKTCRLFKVIEESQLIFRGGAKTKTSDGKSFEEESIDVVEMIDENNFLSGGNSGYDK